MHLGDDGEEGEIKEKLGGFLSQQSMYDDPSTGNLCMKGSRMTIPVANFKFRIVKRVVEEIRKAGYNVFYSVTKLANLKRLLLSRWESQ